MAWNGSGKYSKAGKQTQVSPSPKCHPRLWSIAAGVIFSICGLVYILTKDARQEVQNHIVEKKHKPSKVVEHAPSLQTASNEKRQPLPATTNLPLNVKRDHSELSREELISKVPHWAYTVEDRKRVDPGYEKKHERHLQRLENNPWKTYADNALAVLLFNNGNLGFMPPFNERFKESFLKSIETPIIISKDDPPELQEQKRDLIETKIWIKDQLDAGVDIVKLLNDEYDRQKKINGLRENLRRELYQIQKTATSVQEVEDYVAAANQMLQEQGDTKGIKFSTVMTKYRLKREALRNGDPNEYNQ